MEMENPAKEIVEPPEKQMPVLFPMVSIPCASSCTTQTQPKTAIAMSRLRVAAAVSSDLRGQKEPQPANQNLSIGRSLRNTTYKTKTIVSDPDPDGSLQQQQTKELDRNVVTTAAVGVGHQSMAMGVKRGRGRPRKNVQDLSTQKSSQLLPPRNLGIKEEEMAAPAHAHAHAAEASSDDKIDNFENFAVKSATTLAGMANQNTAVAYVYPRNISHWTIVEVERFFRDHGFVKESIQFRLQEIDGLALSLMSRQNVLYHMGLKLGPALRMHKIICDLQDQIPE